MQVTEQYPRRLVSATGIEIGAVLTTDKDFYKESAHVQ